MDRTLAPRRQSIGRGLVSARKIQDVVDVPFGVEVAHDIGPLARRRDGGAAGARAIGEAFDGHDIDVRRALPERRIEARTRTHVRRWIAFTATGHTNKECRHVIPHLATPRAIDSILVTAGFLALGSPPPAAFPISLSVLPVARGRQLADYSCGGSRGMNRVPF